jgi:hypothetical protein
MVGLKRTRMRSPPHRSDLERTRQQGVDKPASDKSGVDKAIVANADAPAAGPKAEGPRADVPPDDVFVGSVGTRGTQKRRRKRAAGTRGAMAGLKRGPGARMKRAVLGAMMGLSLLGPQLAQAQNVPAAADTTPVEQVAPAPSKAAAGKTLSVFDAMLQQKDTLQQKDARLVAADKGGEDGVHVETTFENDNLPPALGGLIDESQRFGDFGDDDGMTARQRMEVTITSGADDGGEAQQVVGWASWRMLTERRLDGDGAFKADYGHQRSDEISFGAQLNRRLPITDDGNVHLVYGFGAGVQLDGDLGLDKLQDWFHTMPMGGRHLPDSPHGSTGSLLQHNYTNDGVNVSGLLTGGVQLMAQPFANDILTLTAGANTQIPLGQGSLLVQANAGFEVQPLPWVELSGGLRAHGQYVMGEHLDFMADDALKNIGLGADVGLRLNLEELAGLKTSIIAQVHFNDVAGSGMFGESTTYSVGLAIPLGSGSWLSPSR